MSAAAEQRKQIRQLMGGHEVHYSRYNRGQFDKDRYSRNELTDPRYVNRTWLVNVPMTYFKIHLAKHKLKYERETEIEGKRYPEFEREYFMILSKFVSECDNQISVAIRKLEHTPEEKKLIQQVTAELDNIDTKIALMTEEIEILAHNNETTKALLQSVKLQKLKQERKIVAKKVRNITENVGQSAQQKLQVCDVCGAYLSRLDTDRRLADHFLGKVHIGYAKMREQYMYYKQKLNRS
ncbi:related to Protein LUC7 [Nakaseomyces glabratus]|nr:related to Protein LUC7 [Nakaseomyces glabratus]SLM13908.1 related to Protein LUC7 [Nakaseomyces glabratus]